MLIEVFGSGCSKCNATKKLIKEIIETKNVDAEVTAVDDISAIIERGVLMTPAVFIDGKKMIEGRIPDKKTIEKWLLA